MKKFILASLLASHFLLVNTAFTSYEKVESYEKIADASFFFDNPINEEGTLVQNLLEKKDEIELDNIEKISDLVDEELNDDANDSLNKENEAFNNIEVPQQQENHSENNLIAEGLNWRLTDEGILEIFGGFVDGTSLNNSGPSWVPYKSQVKKMVFTEPTVIRSAVSVFDKYDNLVEIEGLELCDVSDLREKNANFMFMNNYKLERLNLSSFDTSKFTGMTSMFDGCSKLTELDLSSFDTTNVTAMTNMFANCTSLSKVDLSNASSQKLTAYGSRTIFGTRGETPITHLALNNKFKLTETMQLRSWSKELHWFDQNNKKIPVTKDLISYHNNNNVKNVYRHGPSYFLDFETDGGSSIESQELLAGEKWTEPENIPKKDGYIFSGWYTDATFTTRFDFNKTVSVSEIAYAKWEAVFVESSAGIIPVGTLEEYINLDDSIEKIKIGERILSADEYTISLLKEIDTSLVTNGTTKVRIDFDKDEWSQYVIIDIPISIVWGSTIATEAYQMGGVLDVSVSLLNGEGIPYLQANKGTGLAILTQLGSRPSFEVYRGDETNSVLSAHYQTVGQAARDLMVKWNEIFDNGMLNYGDVMRYTVVRRSDATVNHNGNNTWISRNNELILETEGYDYAYYELTSEGYHLLRMNQLIVNENIFVPVGTTIDEMNERLDEFINFPNHITNNDDFIINCREIDDTSVSGSEKKGVIEVSEKLLSGGNFTVDYEFSFTVNPVINEYFLDTEGNELKQSQHTEFEAGTNFLPNPTMYITHDNNLYRYVGWKENEEDHINDGKPIATNKEGTYIYIYEAANNLIQVSMPVEMIFGTYEKTEDISSNHYEIINHSKKIGIEVILNEFVEMSSDVHFLEEEEVDPVKETEAARIGIHVGDKLKVNSLNKKTELQTLTILPPERKEILYFSGTYFGDLKRETKTNYSLNLLFKPVEGY
ncbi:BspA family leucine-rich repeat surface protein [Enterococcus faecalis]|uniref:BspA family leucine-rich repeat surface protein n=1 Tax=Enterococcus faecalis TaxID=1351 RepID=UPI0035E95DD2